MNDDTAPHEIARLEGQIEALANGSSVAARFPSPPRSLSPPARLWFALVLCGFAVRATPFVAALAATLGGVVVLGSNATTWNETEAALHQAEAARDALIGAMELRLVAEPPRTLH